MKKHEAISLAALNIGALALASRALQVQRSLPFVRTALALGAFSVPLHLGSVCGAKRLHRAEGLLAALLVVTPLLTRWTGLPVAVAAGTGVGLLVGHRVPAPARKGAILIAGLAIFAFPFLLPGPRVPLEVAACGAVAGLTYVWAQRTPSSSRG